MKDMKIGRFSCVIARYKMLKLVVVWCLAGDDVEMSSEGHENRKLEGGARR